MSSTTTRPTENRGSGSTGTRATVRASAWLGPALFLLLTALSGALPSPVRAQTLVGRVLDESRGGPVGGALVRLLDRDGDERAQSLADDQGRFLLRPPEEGEYYLEATRLGYRRTVSPLLAFSQGDHTASLDLMMVPAPLGLEGLEVEVDLETRVTEDLEISGIRPADLGNRFITRKDIEAVPIRTDVGNVLERQNISNIRVIRPENLLQDSDHLGLCLSLGRARTGSVGRCAIVVLDGLRISGEQALAIDPETLEGMAVLLPVEATTLFGQQGARGALMLWTRSGRAR